MMEFGEEDGEALTAQEEAEVVGAEFGDARLAARIQAIEGLQPAFEPGCIRIHGDPEMFSVILIISRCGGSAFCAAPVGASGGADATEATLRLE